MAPTATSPQRAHTRQAEKSSGSGCVYYYLFATGNFASRAREIHLRALLGKVEDWRAGLGPIFVYPPSASDIILRVGTDQAHEIIGKTRECALVAPAIKLN